MTPLYNPFAPQALNGFNLSVEGCEDHMAWYVFPSEGTAQPILTPSLRLLDQRIPIGTSGDFHWRGLLVWTSGGAALMLRFRDEEGKYLSQAPVQVTNLTGAVDTHNPLPIFPEVVFPSGTELRFDLINTSGALSLTTRLAFLGIKRVRR